MFVRHQSGALIASLENRTGERDFTPGQSRTRSLNAFRMTELEMRRFCEMLAEWRPPYLFGYASALHKFSRVSSRVKQKNISASEPFAPSAEMLRRDPSKYDSARV